MHVTAVLLISILIFVSVCSAYYGDALYDGKICTYNCSIFLIQLKKSKELRSCASLRYIS